MTAKVTAKQLVERLRASLVKPGDDMPGGMFMTEVTLGSRRIDGLYCGFFGSRGRFLRGYEVKVARSDWLAELDQPAKAEAWEQNVHEWWIVAPDTTIVRPEELPHGWGLLVPDPNPRTKTRMLTVAKATRHEDRQPSWEAVHAIIQKADTERMRATGERVRALQAEHREALGRTAPAPVRMDGKGGKARLNPELTEWMMGWPAGWVTASAQLSRAEQLKACGNGVVPQQAAAALRMLLARPGVPVIRHGVAA